MTSRVDSMHCELDSEIHSCLNLQITLPSMVDSSDRPVAAVRSQRHATRWPCRIYQHHWILKNDICRAQSEFVVRNASDTYLKLLRVTDHVDLRGLRFVVKYFFF